MGNQNKYLKYKQKYINLRNIIGGGIDATYNIVGYNLSVEYTLNAKKNVLQYKLIKKLGEGGNGTVDLIEKIGDTTNKYVFKRGINKGSTASYDEGIASDKLKDIIDEDMLVLFQGKSPSDFLIAVYNGNDLEKEYISKVFKIKNEYVNITTQILDLLQKINQRNLFHNDIKLQNITIKNKKVYLIDFGMLKNTSQPGSLINMSFKSLIIYCQNNNWNYYEKYYQKLISILPDTDIVGFFFCCLDLLYIGGADKYLSINIFSELGIKNYDEESMYNLFDLYYFILPLKIRNEINLKNSIVYRFPDFENVIKIFGNVSIENENLFRFIAYIYNKLERIQLIFNLNVKQFKEFLLVLSDCLLPDFNYVNFIPKFNKSVKLLFPNLTQLVNLPEPNVPEPNVPEQNIPNIINNLKQICKLLK